MVRAYHIILCAYGFWLPNDPRGSWSDFIRQWELLRFGGPRKVNTRTSVAARPHDRARREAAKQALRYPPVHFTGEQALAIARGFARAKAQTGLVFYACSILPEHVHLVLPRPADAAQRVAARCKAMATHELQQAGLHPLADQASAGGRTPSPWSRGQWTVFLDSDRAIQRAIAYVEHNPVKEGKPRQRWWFVDRPW